MKRDRTTADPGSDIEAWYESQGWVPHELAAGVRIWIRNEK